jgi:hypothetical protein
VHNGDDSPTDSGRVGEVPRQPQNETDAGDTDQLQQVPETPSSEDDGNEGDSEGQAGYHYSDDPGLASGHGRGDGWVTTTHTGDLPDGLEEAMVDYEVYVGLTVGRPDYTISMRWRAYKGSDDLPLLLQTRETPARFESATHRDSGGGAQQQQQQQQQQPQQQLLPLHQPPVPEDGGWVTTNHTGNVYMDALKTEAEYNEVYVDLRSGGPEYTISMRPRVYNGGDGTTDGTRVGEVRVEAPTHRGLYTRRQQNFYGTGQLQQIPVETSSSDDDGNEGDSEGQASDCDGGSRGRTTGHGDAERRRGTDHRPAGEPRAPPARAVKRKWTGT